jgi:hypothetical protein
VGYDAGKKVKGRKVHALVDTEGLPLRVIVHSAGIQDRDGAALALDRIRRRFNWLELVWADGGDNAHQVKTAAAKQPPLRVELDLAAGSALAVEPVGLFRIRAHRLSCDLRRREPRAQSFQHAGLQYCTGDDAAVGARA